jgi:hypothetical protein
VDSAKRYNKDPYYHQDIALNNQKRILGYVSDLKCKPAGWWVSTRNENTIFSAAQRATACPHIILF